MKKFIITEEEKNRILNMHKSRTSNQYLMEQNPGDKAPIEQLPKEMQDFVKRYNLSGYFNYSGEKGIRFGYNKGNTHSDIAASDIQTYETNKEKLSQCQERIEFFKKTYNNLLTGTNVQSKDPKMQEHCERYPEDPKCQNQATEKMDHGDANTKATNLMNKKFPNMEFCDVVLKVDRIIKM